jgi:hypothetical protein
MSMSEKRRFKAILGAETQLKDTWLSADDKLADLEIVSGKEGIEPSFNLHRLRPLRLFIARIRSCSSYFPFENLRASRMAGDENILCQKANCPRLGVV